LLAEEWTVFADLVTVLAGGSYIRCFNVVSGSLLWESSVASAVPSHRASIQLIGFGEFNFSASAFHITMTASLL